MKMRKNLRGGIILAAALGMLFGFSLTAMAAEPGEVTVLKDEKFHQVTVFGDSLTLSGQDGSIEIVPANEAGTIDVMLNGTVQKGKTSCTIEPGANVKIVVESGSRLITNLTSTEAAGVKAAVAGGASLPEVSGNTYTVIESGALVNAAGESIQASAVGIKITSVNAEALAFGKRMEEIREEDARKAAEEARQMAEARARKEAEERGNSAASNPAPAGSASASAGYICEKCKKALVPYTGSDWGSVALCCPVFNEEVDRYGHSYLTKEGTIVVLDGAGKI